MLELDQITESVLIARTVHCRSNQPNMAGSIKLSLTLVLLISGLVMLGKIESSEAAAAACNMLCARGTYITCCNRPGEALYGCACKCAPPGGKDCVVHYADGSTSKC
ncbi:hypothetical protein DAI22_03g328000 [Oryza sativa Japonica Group]|nr:hypothetical protein DAI22_03g328000 [Oryza sativa Japonica Group]